MSTILQAQQKSKLEQAGGPPPIIQQNSAIQPWKVLVGLALATIITLLSVLIYLLLNPRPAVAPNTLINNELQPAQQSKQLVKVTFATQPLSVISAAPEKSKRANQTQKTATIAPPEALEQAQQLIAPTVAEDLKTQQAPAQATEIREASEASEALKKRFELAVLLSEIENKEPQTDVVSEDQVLNDGSDIHQMSSTFQDKVPLIRYDSHMYSSIVAQRWIRINGEVLKEGDFDSSGRLELLEIEPQRSIFRLDRQSFSLESLVDWKGY